MRFKRTLLAGAAISVALAVAAVAQSISYDNVTGNECWNAGEGPGGPSAFLCLNTVRNGMAQVTAIPSGAQTLGTGTYANLAKGGNLLITSQPVATVTLTAPPNPVPDGAIIGVCNATGSAFATTNIAIVANTGQTFNSTASLNNLGATCINYQFKRSTTTWYRIQ